MKTVLIDFDGVVGSQRKYIGPGGERAFLEVSSRDSMAIRRMVAAGVQVIIVTASGSELIREYAGRHGCALVVSKNKARDVAPWVNFAEVVAVGDDLSDVGYLEQAALAYCPADAHPEVKKHFPSLESPGGGGCIAELEILCHDKIYRTSPQDEPNGAVVR